MWYLFFLFQKYLSQLTFNGKVHSDMKQNVLNTQWNKQGTSAFILQNTKIRLLEIQFLIPNNLHFKRNKEQFGILQNTNS